MSSKTKIVVLHMKEIIYTAVFVALGILLIILLTFMFFPKKEKEVFSNSTITPRRCRCSCYSSSRFSRPFK